MTHEEIREPLELRDVPDADCAQVNVLLDAHIEHVERRIRDLNTLREQLASLRHQCQIASATRDCGILQALARAAARAASRGLRRPRAACTTD